MLELMPTKETDKCLATELGRLEILADRLEAFVPTPECQFDMEIWECGTAACAVGLACQIPEFNSLGLRLERTSWGGLIMASEPVFADHTNWDAVRVFFGITLKEAFWLFSEEQYPDDDTTAQEVAARIRTLLAEKRTQQEQI